MANSDPGHSEINFASGLTGMITLADIPDLQYNFMRVIGPLTILGPGADLLTIDARHASRFFFVTMPAPGFILSGVTLAKGHTVGHGGAIYSATTTSLRGVVIRDGISDTHGGCISIAGANLVVIDSTITGCAADGGAGGGIFVNVGGVVLANSTVEGNVSSAFGGGVAATGTLQLLNSTVTGNLASADGAGFVAGNDAIVRNSIIADNLADTGPDEFRVGGTLTISHSLVRRDSVPAVSPVINGNVIGVDPLLGPLQDNGGPTPTQGLFTGSPAIDAGNNALIPPGSVSDQRGPGFPRIVYGTVDMGAVEAPERPVLVFADGFEPPI